MEERRTEGKHTLMLEKRGVLTLTGVLEVMSFDEESVAADTDCGVIIIHGENLHIENLNLDKGDMSLKGEISSIVYEDSERYMNPSASFFGRLFR